MKKTFLSLVLFVMLVACGEQSVVPVVTNLDRLVGEISKQWVMQKASVFFPASSTIKPNPAELLLNCEVDDGWIFYRDGKFEKIENATKCQGETSPKISGRWTADDTYANITFSNFSLLSAKNKTDLAFSVSNLTDSTLTLTGGVIFPNTEKLELNLKSKK